MSSDLITSLERLARAIGTTEHFERLISQKIPWERSEDYDVVDLRRTGLLGLVYDPDGPPIPDGTCIELVRVIGVLPPHVHYHSDSVVVVHTVTEDALAFNDERHWYELSNGEVILVPRGVMHGFKREEGGRSFLLLVVSNPPIAENDYHF